MNYSQITDHCAEKIAEDLLSVRAALLDYENADKFGPADSKFLEAVASDTHAVAILVKELARRRELAVDTLYPE